MNPPSTARELRMYESIWIRLKKDGKVRVACLPEDHARIVKAVTKEKDIDVGYKLEQQEAGKKLKIRATRKTTYIDFELFKILYVGGL